MKLTLEFIESLDLDHRLVRTDHSDWTKIYTLPNGLNVECMTVCDGEPCLEPTLYAVQERIEIDTREELEEISNMTLVDIVDQKLDIEDLTDLLNTSDL